MKIIASNFKTNHTRKSTKDFVYNLENFIENKHKNKHKIIVFPPSTALLEDKFQNLKIGIQNAYHETKGSFTGEIGLEQINEFNINTILIGHSERRDLFGDNQAMCVNKFDFFKEHKFEIIYCIGENIKIKEMGIKATMDFLESQFENIDTKYKNLIVAYEPIWAIGSGISAKNSDIEEVHYNLKKILGNIPIIYGGSVKPNNAQEIMSIKNVDGVLVGSASWDIDSFCQIIENAKEL